MSQHSCTFRGFRKTALPVSPQEPRFCAAPIVPESTSKTRSVCRWKVAVIRPGSSFYFHFHMYLLWKRTRHNVLCSLHFREIKQKVKFMCFVHAEHTASSCLSCRSSAKRRWETLLCTWPRTYDICCTWSKIPLVLVQLVVKKKMNKNNKPIKRRNTQKFPWKFPFAARDRKWIPLVLPTFSSFLQKINKEKQQTRTTQKYPWNFHLLHVAENSSCPSHFVELVGKYWEKSPVSHRTPVHTTEQLFDVWSPLCIPSAKWSRAKPHIFINFSMFYFDLPCFTSSKQTIETKHCACLQFPTQPAFRSSGCCASIVKTFNSSWVAEIEHSIFGRGGCMKRCHQARRKKGRDTGNCCGLTLIKWKLTFKIQPKAERHVKNFEFGIFRLFHQKNQLLWLTIVSDTRSDEQCSVFFFLLGFNIGHSFPVFRFLAQLNECLVVRTSRLQKWVNVNASGKDVRTAHTSSGVTLVSATVFLLNNVLQIWISNFWSSGPNLRLDQWLTHSGSKFGEGG